MNPGRDIGPSRIHGITAEDLLDAPTFAEVAGTLIEHVDGCVAIAAHNARFDRQFLESEFSHSGHAFPECEFVCTMQLGWGGSLAACCADFGVAFDGEAHHALADARAAARLLVRLLEDNPQAVAPFASAVPIRWPSVPRSTKRPITRDDSRRRRAEPLAYLQRLLARSASLPQPAADSEALLAYTELLDRVLEDRHISADEGDALFDLAEEWGISAAGVRAAHGRYVHQLAIAAAADGVVTDAERRDLELVARLLGVDTQALGSALIQALKGAKTAPVVPPPPMPGESLAGKRVCFTGELLCRYRGQPLTREVAEELATNAGLTVADSVTKKLDLLVVADPHTQSGKAKKARQYGIRVMHEPVFWRAVGVEVT